MRTALVGMIHDAAAFGVLTDDPHAEGGEDGEECEDEDGSHESDSIRVFGSRLIWKLFLFQSGFSPSKFRINSASCFNFTGLLI